MVSEPIVSVGCDHCKKRLSWSAILAGAFVGVGLSFLLNLFSLAIGLSAFTTTKESVTVFAVGGFLGFAIGTFAAMLAAGWTAGHLGRSYCPKRNLGVLYGFTTWCLALVLTVLLSSPVARFVSSYSGYITNHSVTIVKMANQSTTTVVASQDNGAVTVVDADGSVNNVGKAALALFALFFVGAFASCIGGHCGMTCRKDDSCSSSACSTTTPKE